MTKAVLGMIDYKSREERSRATHRYNSVPETRRWLSPANGLVLASFSAHPLCHANSSLSGCL